jgi:hypothetical protein
VHLEFSSFNHLIETEESLFSNSAHLWKFCVSHPAAQGQHCRKFHFHVISSKAILRCLFMFVNS